MTYEQMRKLPKVELHVHLDCCLSYEAVQQLAPGMGEDEYLVKFTGPAKCSSLEQFLTLTQSPLQLMQSYKGLRVAVQDLFSQFCADNVIYAEIRFAPLLHTREGLLPENVVQEVEEEVTRCVEQTGIEARIILCSLRHFSAEESMTTAVLTEDFRGSRVAGLDLAADEAGSPLTDHINAFAYVRSRFIPTTAHAGEAKGPESIIETLERLKPCRIGHGVRCIEDNLLVQKLASDHTHLEICPSCNIQINVFDSYSEHPINFLYNQGVSLGVNTDARAITRLTLTEEYMRLQETFDWNKSHFLTCNHHALNASFLPELWKKKLARTLKKAYEA